MRYGRKWMAAVAMGLLSLNAMAQKLTEYVDPFIGTTNFSVCNPGAVLPHGPDVGRSLQRDGKRPQRV